MKGKKGFQKGYALRLGIRHSKESKEKISFGHKGMKKPWVSEQNRLHKGRPSPMKGRRHSEETKKRMAQYRGSDRYNWTGGIKYRDKQSLYNPVYIQWRNKVFERDKYKCRIANSDCLGQLEAHHILPWRDFPELRYEINNGITLCHAHHPRKVAEEKRLEPIFQVLVAESKAIIF